MKNFYSNGKLLLTGEYLVIDGALALAVPTSYGQSLTVNPIIDDKLIWKSIGSDDSIWFEDEFLNEQIERPQINHNEIHDRLLQIINIVKQFNPNFLKNSNGFYVETKLDFPRNWGLGSSSTLINNIAQWANIDAYQLLEHTFGGSGYDIACAQNDSAIIYQLIKQNDSLNQIRDVRRQITQVDFNLNFSEQLYFVHLNQKQNSREGIKQYKANKKNINLEISEISTITKELLSCDDFTTFNKLVTVHEKIIASVIKEQPIKERVFSGFDGAIKSLGAWGGDFILVSSEDNPQTYFKNKGFNTIIPYKNMVLKAN